MNRDRLDEKYRSAADRAGAEEELKKARRSLDDACRQLGKIEERIKLAVNEARQGHLLTWEEIADSLGMVRSLVARRYYSGPRGSTTTRVRVQVNGAAIDSTRAAEVKERLAADGDAQRKAGEARDRAIEARYFAVDAARDWMQQAEIAHLLNIKPLAVKHLVKQVKDRRKPRRSQYDNI